MKREKKRKGSLDYYLILATAAALFVISVIGIFGMFSFKPAASLLQVIVLVMALTGSERLHLEKSGYWVRVGSSLIHLGLILFVLDLLLYRYLPLHLFLFWVTTGASVPGMLLCFYSQAAARIFRIQGRSGNAW